MEDEKILALYQNRNEDAVVQTQEKYGSYCKRIAANILGNPEDVGECLNDTWLRAWRSIPPEEPKNFKAFLARITRNLALDAYRRMNAEKRGRSGATLCLEELSECFGKDDVSEALDREILVEILNDFLSEQDKRDRGMFVGRYFYGSTLEELSKQYGLSKNHVSVTLHRMRKDLKDVLVQLG